MATVTLCTVRVVLKMYFILHLHYYFFIFIVIILVTVRVCYLVGKLHCQFLLLNEMLDPLYLIYLITYSLVNVDEIDAAQSL